MKLKHLKAILIFALCMMLFATSALAAPVSGAAAATTSQGRLIIREAGDYTLTGSMRGTVYVDPGAGDVKPHLRRRGH